MEFKVTCLLLLLILGINAFSMSQAASAAGKTGTSTAASTASKGGSTRPTSTAGTGRTKMTATGGTKMTGTGSTKMTGTGGTKMTGTTIATSSTTNGAVSPFRACTNYFFQTATMMVCVLLVQAQFRKF